MNLRYRFEQLIGLLTLEWVEWWYMGRWAFHAVAPLSLFWVIVLQAFVLCMGVELTTPIHWRSNGASTIALNLALASILVYAALPAAVKNTQFRASFILVRMALVLLIAHVVMAGLFHFVLGWYIRVPF